MGHTKREDLDFLLDLNDKVLQLWLPDLPVYARTPDGDDVDAPDDRDDSPVIEVFDGDGNLVMDGITAATACAYRDMANGLGRLIQLGVRGLGMTEAEWDKEVEKRREKRLRGELSGARRH